MAKKKNHVPKKIAGVKIPKVFRKNTLLKGLLGSATGRQLVADALIAAATAAAGVLVASQTKVGAKATEGVVEAGAAGADVLKEALASAAGAVKDVLGNAAKAVVGEHGNNRPELRTRH